MSILRDIFNRVIGAPVPTTGAPPATPTTHEPMSSTTVAALRSMLNEHDRGVFMRSALLARLMTRDADIFGALQQRLGLQASYPTLVDPPKGVPSPEAADDAAALLADLSRICPAGVALDMWTDEALLGFALAQVVWEAGPDGILRQRLVPVDGSAVEHDRTTDQWYVHTLDQGRLAIKPGDGQWVLFAPSSARAPWLWGAVRPCAAWWLSNSNVENDARRRSETTGQGIWKAKLPAGARQTPDGLTFIRSLRNIGRAAVIPIPQGSTPESSYDIELIEAQVDAFKIFEWLRRAGGGAVRLAILGQDLTSQNNTVGTNASSETGADVLRTITRSRARAWGETLTAQVAAPRARYLGCTRSIVRVDAEPKADRRAEADAQEASARAVTAWQTLGIDVDVAAHATAAGVSVAETPTERTEAVAEIYAWHITTGVVTPDEARARLGLDPLPGGAGTKPTPIDLPGPADPDPNALSARRLAARSLPSQEEIARRLADTLRAHVGERAPDLIAALRGSTDRESARKALTGVMDKAPPPDLVREVAGFLELARLVGDATARK